MKRETWGGAALFALALGWAGSAAAAPSSPSAAPVVSNTPAPDAPIELDMALSGATRAQRSVADSGAGEAVEEQRPLLDPGRQRINALVVFSAADGVGVGGQVRSGIFGLQGSLSYQ